MTTTLNSPLSVSVKLSATVTWFHTHVPFLLAQSGPVSAQLVSSNFSHEILWASVIPNCIVASSSWPHKKILGNKSPSIEQVTISPCKSLSGFASLFTWLKKSTIGLVCVAPKSSTIIRSTKFGQLPLDDFSTI